MSMPISFMAAMAKPSSSPLRTPTEETTNPLPNAWRMRAAAIGERTEFCPQANSTARGFVSGSPNPSPFPMQDADEGEQAPCGLEINRHLVLEALHQKLRAFVVQRTAAHIDRLDAIGRGSADGLVIAVADHEIVLHDPPQRRQRQQMGHHRRIVGIADVEHQAVAGDAQVELEGPARLAFRRDRILVERHRHQPVGLARGWSLGRRHRGLMRIATERACASSPSASPSAIAAGPSACNCSGPHLRIEVRFMKSSTPSPDEKRAERAVGSTWLEPPT